MRLRSVLIVSVGLAGLGWAGFLALDSFPQHPLDARVVSVEASGDRALPRGGPTKAVLVEFQRRNPAARFNEPQRLQTRVAGRWQEPQRFPELEDSVLFAVTNRERVVFIVPAQTEACRFLLAYRAGARPYCQALFFVQRHGLDRRFPKLSRWALKCFPRQARLRHAELELLLPKEFRLISGLSPGHSSSDRGWRGSSSSFPGLTGPPASPTSGWSAGTRGRPV